MDRKQMIAHFVVHGWEPASIVKSQMPLRETGLIHSEFGLIRISRKRKIGSHPAKMALSKYRQPREWKQITTPRLLLMYECWERTFNPEEASHGTNT